MTKKSISLLLLIVLASSALSFFMLTRGHVWLDDFAAYVMQAKSILAWNMDEFIIHNAFTIENSSYPPGPVAYPWGFPLLLAPVYGVFGLNALALKLVSIGFYALFLLVFYFFARTRLDEWDSLLLTGCFALNPSLLSANDFILSDIPFLAFSTLGILLADRHSRSPSLKSGFALGVVIFMAFFIRTNGILLLVLAALSMLFHHPWQKAIKHAIPPFITFGIFLTAQLLLFPEGQASYFSHFSMFTPARLLDNFLYYLWLPSWTFEYLPGGMVFYPILVIFLFISISAHFRRDSAVYAYSLLTVLIFILWPERQGLRFIYPVLPFLFIFALEGMKLAAQRIKSFNGQWLVKGFWILLLGCSLAVTTNWAYENMATNREINGPFDIYSNQMFEFIREKTPKDSVMIFVRPRALRLFTDHDSFMTENCEDLPKGDYIVVHKKMADNGQIPPEQVESCNQTVSLESVFNNKRFTIYKITK